jgi:hypothetical protein
MKKTYAQLKKQFALTPAELQTIGSAAYGVWQYIAPDLMSGDMAGKTIRKAEVIELVLDANRFEDALKRTAGFKASPTLQAMFAKSYDTDVYAFLDKYLAKEVFKHARYE